jgi:hypothetical protein
VRHAAGHHGGKAAHHGGCRDVGTSAGPIGC